MSSIMVSGQVKLGRRVGATTADRARNQRTMQGLLERCADVVPEGIESVTLDEALFYVGRQIVHELDELRLHDDANLEQLVALQNHRQDRDESLSELYQTVLRGRQAIDAIFGSKEATKLLGPKAQVPNDPERLHQTAERCRRWLVTSSFQMPKTELGKVFEFKPEAMIRLMADPLDRLGAALEALPEEERNSVDTLVAKLRALDRLTQLIGQSARFFEALYDLAGMKEESERIRRSSHQAKVQDSSEAPPEAAVEETSEAPADARAAAGATSAAAGDTAAGPEPDAG